MKNMHDRDNQTARYFINAREYAWWEISYTLKETCFLIFIRGEPGMTLDREAAQLRLEVHKPSLVPSSTGSVASKLTRSM